MSEPIDAAEPRDPVGHAPVLVAPIVELLKPTPGKVMLDCTVGRGGHGAAIAPLLSPGGRYIGLDVDPANVAFAHARLAGVTSVLAQSDADTPLVRVDIVRANFTDARVVLDSLDVDRVDLLLADLGFASTQMDDPERGFSFAQDGPLDMRLDPQAPTTAADLVNALSAGDLANLIYEFGEERLSRRIAQKIVEARQKSPIKTTAHLAQIVRSAYGAAHAKRHKPSKSRRHGDKGRRGSHRIDPATRTFMALRIAVNQELDALESLLNQLTNLMAPDGRAALISFHSLEDRLVKRAFADLERADLGNRLTRKPVTADAAEATDNPRSRSAKLRVFEFEALPLRKAGMQEE